MFDIEGGLHPRYNHPSDGKVNNFQAVKWLELLCVEAEAKIVVTSTWRREDNYKECLYNGGLCRDIEIVGRTPRLDGENRGSEIQRWLDDNSHLQIDNFIIIDDDSDMDHLLGRLVLCDSEWGFGMNKYIEAKKMLNEQTCK